MELSLDVMEVKVTIGSEGQIKEFCLKAAISQHLVVPALDRTYDYTFYRAEKLVFKIQTTESISSRELRVIRHWKCHPLPKPFIVLFVLYSLSILLRVTLFSPERFRKYVYIHF